MLFVVLALVEIEQVYAFCTGSTGVCPVGFQAKFSRGYDIFAQDGLIIVLFWFLARLFNILVWDGIVARKVGTPTPNLIKFFSHLTFMLLSAAVALSFVHDQSLTGIWVATAGGLFGLAFASKDILADCFWGIAISVDQSYKIGQWLRFNGTVGCVENITWRATLIRNKDKNLVIVPHSMMGQMMIENLSLPKSISRFVVEITVDAGIPIDRVERILRGALTTVKGVVTKPSSKIRSHKTSDLGVVYKIKFCIDTGLTPPGDARTNVMRAAAKALEAAGIPMARQGDIFLLKDPVRMNAASDSPEEFLKQVPLFRALNESEFSDLATEMQLCKFAKGESIIRQGDDGESLYILVEGACQVLIDQKGGKKLEVGRLGAKNSFGEMSLLTGEKRSATVKALTGIRAFEIQKEHLASLLKKRPELAKELSQLMAKRLQQNEDAQDAAQKKEGAKSEASLIKNLMGKIKRFFKL